MTPTPDDSDAPKPDATEMDRGFWDIERKRDEDRADTEHTLENTRWDAQLKRQQDRTDTQKGLDNTRWDTGIKRDLDRADTQQGLVNARWDTSFKRDQDRADTQRALDNTRRDTELALLNARWDTDHKRHDDRVDTALALKNAREDTALANETALLEAVHAGYIAVAQNSLDRALSRATFLTTGSAAIVTLYTGLLGLRFSADKGAALPARALAPGMFLAGAVIFSTFYVAFLRRRTVVTELLPSGVGGNVAQARLQAFIEWVTAGVIARAWSLRLAVVSLALGLALLPIGFVQLSTATARNLIIGAVGILALCLLIEIGVAVASRASGDTLFAAPPKLPPGPRSSQPAPPTPDTDQPADVDPPDPPADASPEVDDEPPAALPTTADGPPPSLQPNEAGDPPSPQPDVAPAVSPTSAPGSMQVLAEPPRPPASPPTASRPGAPSG
jgi:hypothetical protein